MPISLIIHKDCPICGKRAEEVKRFSLGEKVLITLKCSHVLVEAYTKASSYEFTSLTKNYTPKPFQIEGIKFAEKGKFRVLIADEQGLGKTIQVLGLIRLHPELLPILVITKATIKNQWFHEIVEWCGKENYLTQVLNSGKEKALPGFQVYVATYDYIKNENAFDMIEDDLKTLVLDECQAIKNHLSGRAKACQKVASRVENIIALSGTPIKNHAGEYFTILNILQPSRFPEFNRFIREYCRYEETSYGYKVGGLKYPQEFYKDTEDFIIRRTREEVAPELPKVFRQFYHVELDKKLNAAYQAGMKELDELMYKEDAPIAATIAIMTKLRRITGISKASEECVDFVTGFLLENERKIVVFLHHHAAADLLEAKLNVWMKDGGFNPVLSLNSSLDSFGRTEVIRKFRDEPYRVMIASTLVAGEGINLQFCSDAIMLERQWNPANEEQAEGRFSRFGSTANQVNIVYMIASETIDEYFTELVEKKRSIVSSTLDKKEIIWDSNSLMKELAGILIQKGRERWKL